MTSLEVPDGTTAIDDEAFKDRTDIVRVLIPSSVTTIWKSAFGDCSPLTDVTIPSSVTSIEDYDFYECCLLTGVTIPSSVTSIGDRFLEMQPTNGRDHPQLRHVYRVLCFLRLQLANARAHP